VASRKVDFIEIERRMVLTRGWSGWEGRVRRY
jgi:hypothetical protein